MIVQRMFSEKNLEQREFNSKSMKALRKAYDYQVGLKALEKSGAKGEIKKAGDAIKDIIKAGRKEIKPKYNYTPVNVNEAINDKAVLTPLTTGSVVAKELRVPKGIKAYKKEAKGDRKEIKRLLKKWDHGNPKERGSETIEYAKDIMKTARTNKNIVNPLNW